MAMRYQPQGLLRIDQGHPLAAGLRVAMLPGVNRAFDVGGMRSATPSGLKQVGGSLGMAAGFGSVLGAGTGDKIVTGLNGAFPANGRSYFFKARRNGAGGGNLGRLFDKTNGSTGQMLYWSSTSNALVVSFYAGGAEQTAPIAGSSTACAVGQDFDVLLVHSQVGSSAGFKAYLNGALILNTGITATINDAPTTPLTIGNRNSDNARGWDGLIECAYVWDRILSDGEAAQLSANRYQLFVDPNDSDDVVAAVLGSYKLTAAAGAFALSAPAASLRASRSMPATGGAFSLAGASAALAASRRVAAGAGAFALSAVPAGLISGRRLPAGGGMFALAGAAAEMLSYRRLALGAGAFALAGSAPTLRAARRLAASSGAFAVGPASVQMVYQPAVDPGGGLAKYTLTAAPGSFGIVGSSALLRAARQLQAASGGFLLSESEARLAVGRRLQVGTGGLSIAGAAITLLAARRIPAQAGTLDLQGLPIQLRYSAQIEYVSAPAGSGYTPQRHEYQTRPSATSSPRPAATQRNIR